jgi:hypothetical protein
MRRRHAETANVVPRPPTKAVRRNFCEQHCLRAAIALAALIGDEPQTPRLFLEARRGQGRLAMTVHVHRNGQGFLRVVQFFPMAILEKPSNGA